MPDQPSYPFVPRSTAYLIPGQFWGLPLSDGRYGCARVLRIGTGNSHESRVDFIFGLLDWVDTQPPNELSIAGAKVVEVGCTAVRTLDKEGPGILGYRSLRLDDIEIPDRVYSYFSPGPAAEHRFVKGDPPPKWSLRSVGSPLTDAMLAPPTTPSVRVQFSSRLTDSDFERLGQWLNQYPQASLRAYGSYDGSLTDLDFLRFFPTLREFEASALHSSLTSLDGLRYAPETLQSLTIGATKARLDLSVLERFGELQNLYIEKQTKGIEVLSRLASLQSLTLRSVTLPDLSLLLPLNSLQALDLKLGGTHDLALLPKIGRLRYLELWMIRGLTDISAIAGLPELKYLFLESLRNVEQLPDLSDNVALVRVHLQTMKGLRDLTPFRSAPALSDLVLIDMGHLHLEDLEPLVGHPTLQRATLGLGSLRKNDGASTLLGLPSADGKLNWREV